MANPQHLQILAKGVKAWNEWWGQPRDMIKPDLLEANLREANLLGANLREADLLGANLRGANLSEADLSEAILLEADLRGANLRGANLRGADLSEAILREAILRGANLRGANLSEAILLGADLGGANLRGGILLGADLSRANLSEADLSEVWLYGTVFGDINLTTVQGLETCVHRGPSALDHLTLARSGSLPLVFLRGCGLPDALIDNLPALLNEPFQFYSCFISHASKDHAFAERLYADLQNKGVRCWFAPEDMKIGDRIRSRIDETIRVYDKLLLVLSKASVTSQWVEQEVETALARERQQRTTVLFPVRIDNTVMTLETGWPALIRNARNIGDFRHWKTHDVYQQAFDRLLRDLKAAEPPPHG
jgi:TIR domain-containing protein/pentapeptide repeat protein